jgi:hypothetical protein
MVRSWGWRLLLVASVVLIVAGIALLATALLPPPAEPATPDLAGGHRAIHESGAIFVPGVAVHPGPGVDVLAAEMTPVTGATSILAVTLSPEATPVPAASPGAVAQDQ